MLIQKRLKGNDFISICKEGHGGVDSEKIYQNMVEESLEEIIEYFLETGVLKYTIDKNMTMDRRPVRVRKMLYPDVDKLYLFKCGGRFRKRPKEIGGNIVEIRY